MTHIPPKSIAIIGAGVAGLATAKALKAEGFSCTVYDRNDQLGGVWADGYAGFGVQVQKDLYEFPDFPLSTNSSDFTPGNEFRAYLEAYCDHFGIRDCLRLGTEVIALRELPEDGWDLDLSRSGEAETRTVDHLVIATGLYSETPTMPTVPGALAFGGTQFHSSEVKDFELFRGRRIAVVGYGKSATDIAMGAVPVADRVHLVFRTAHWPVPRKLLGLLPFKWGMLTRLTASLIPPYVRPSPAVRVLHSIGAPLPWLFWRVVEVLLRVQQRLGTRIARGKTLVPDQKVEIDAFSEKTMVPRPGFVDLIRSGKITAHRSGLQKFETAKLLLEDGDELDVDMVVYGTGWKVGYQFLPEDMRCRLGEEPDGFYLYRHMLHPNSPNLAFVGRASSFMSVTTYALQARWLAEVLSGRVDLPDAAAMMEEIEALKKWKRSWMPDGPARSATLLLHMAHYHDELVKDLGEDPMRKTGVLGPLKEVLVPYTSSDFRNVVASRPDLERATTLRTSPEPTSPELGHTFNH